MNNDDKTAEALRAADAWFADLDRTTCGELPEGALEVWNKVHAALGGLSP